MQTIYNAITHGTPCVVVEGSGRVADVIAQVASLPISEITISLIQQKLATFFQELFETFTEGRIVEWTKKVRRAAPGPWARPTRGARSHTGGQEAAQARERSPEMGALGQHAVLPSSAGSRTSRLQNLRPGLGSCRRGAEVPGGPERWRAEVRAAGGRVWPSLPAHELTATRLSGVGQAGGQASTLRRGHMAPGTAW